MIQAQLVGGIHLVTSYLTGTTALITDGAGPAVTWTMVVNFVVGVLSPIVVALVTKYEADPRFRALLLLGVSVATGVLNDWLVSSGSFSWLQSAFNAMIVFTIGVASLFGLWKPTGVNESAKRSLVQ